MSEIGFDWPRESSNRSEPTIDSIVRTVQNILQNLTTIKPDDALSTATISTSENSMITTVSSIIDETVNTDSTISNTIANVTSNIAHTTIEEVENQSTTLLETISSSISTESVTEQTTSEVLLNEITTVINILNNTVNDVSKSTSQDTTEHYGSQVTNFFTNEQIDNITSSAYETTPTVLDFTTKFTSTVETITTELNGSVINDIIKKSESSQSDAVIYSVVGVMLLVCIIIIICCYVSFTKCKKNSKSGEYYVAQMSDINKSNGKSHSIENNCTV